MVQSCCQGLFLAIGAFTRPPEMLPAWANFTEDDFKPASEHFARAIARLGPEQVEKIEIFGEPVAGMIALYGVYRVGVQRERELMAWAQQQVDRPNPNGQQQQSRQQPQQQGGTNLPDGKV